MICDPKSGVKHQCVYYGWMNSKAMAEGRKCNGYLCFEAVGAAACMAKCPSHTLVKVRAGFDQGSGPGRWQGERAQSLSHVLSSISGARRAVDSVGLRSPMDLLAGAGERALHAGERAACSGAYADAQALQHAVSSLGAARTKGKLRSARERAACAGSMLLWKYRWSDVRGCMRASKRQSSEWCVCKMWYGYTGWPIAVWARSAMALVACAGERANVIMPLG